MCNYERLLFKSPIPFVIIEVNNNNLKIKETNINFKEENIDKSEVENSYIIKEIVNFNSNVDNESISLKYRGSTYNLYVDKLPNKDVLIWFKIQEVKIHPKEENICDVSNMNFLSNLMHEFKTPLNLIFSSMQLLDKKLENDNLTNHEMKKYLNIVNQNSYRILKLVNNIVDDSKIDVGTDDYEPVNYDIVYFIESICDSVDSFIKSNNMVLTFDTDVEELMVSFDMEKMERIILNLISNAIKFRKKEEGNIDITILSNDKYVDIIVRDNGIGIEKDNIDKIFKKYVRLNDERSIIKEGTGIGLSLVEALTKLHEGSVSVDSEFGKWTEFKIQIPNKVIEKNENKKIESNNLDRVEKIKIEFSDIYS